MLAFRNAALRCCRALIGGAAEAVLVFDIVDWKEKRRRRRPGDDLTGHLDANDCGLLKDTMKYMSALVGMRIMETRQEIRKLMPAGSYGSVML